MKIWGFKGIERNECHSYPFHFLPLKLSNKKIDFLFPSLKLPNKGMKEYSKIILFIHFYYIPFSLPKRGLNAFHFIHFHSLTIIPFHSIYLQTLKRRGFPMFGILIFFGFKKAPILLCLSRDKIKR